MFDINMSKLDLLKWRGQKFGQVPMNSPFWDLLTKKNKK